MSARAEHAGMYIAAEEATPAIVVLLALVVLVALGWYAWKNSGFAGFVAGLKNEAYDPTTDGLAKRLGLATGGIKNAVVQGTSALQQGWGVLAAKDQALGYLASSLDVLRQHFVDGPGSFSTGT